MLKNLFIAVLLACTVAPFSGINWQAGERLSFSILGQNLLNEQRLEYETRLRA